jgi:hypothetical protein
MIDLSGFDAVLVINHQTPVEALAARVRASHHHRVLVLSSHLVFPHELSRLEIALAPTSVCATALADWFSDEELEACDEATTTALLGTPARCTLYRERFEETAAQRKNALVLAALRRAGLPASARLYAADGLGVSAAVWLRAGASSLPPRPTLKEKLRHSGLGRAHAYFSELARRLPSTVIRIRDRGTDYVFPYGIRRLALAPDVVPERIPLQEALRAKRDYCLAVGLHDHHLGLQRHGMPLRIFVDGFLPPNYPRTYFDTFGEAEFVCPDPISPRWLRRWNARLAPPPGFLAEESFAPASTPSTIQSVVILLGHAGNWSSLINRSDNDALVATALELAAAEPSLTVILRPHPSMEHPRHEGAGARSRLQEAATAAAQTNVELSTASLQEDLARGDLVVAEYSAALIEAWRTGRLGLAVNATRRRSFMQDFADLGFAHATGRDDFVAAVRRCRANPPEFPAHQSIAAARYNRLVQEYRSAH